MKLSSSLRTFDRIAFCVLILFSAQATFAQAAKPAAPAAKPAAAAGGFDTDALKKLVGLVLKAEHLRRDGRTVRARRLLAEAEKGFAEIFAPGKTITVSGECPLMVRGKPGSQRVGLACFPAGAEGRLVFDFYRTTGVFTNKEHLTDDSVVAQLEDFPIFQEFTGTFQVVQDLTGKHAFDLERLVVYVKLQKVAPVGGKPAGPATKPAAKPAATAASGGEAAPPPEPASLEDESVMRCRPMLVLPADPPEKPRSRPPSGRPVSEIRLQRCESSEAVCIVRKNDTLSCWPKSK